jgi:choline kinase
MKPTLVILAAGMASRYGSMKQVQSFGPGGETIMDYSIYDAIRAGFGKVVFIIRAQYAAQFQSIFEPKLKGLIETEYVFQELDSFTNGYSFPTERSKPWGTAHAVLCAKEVVKEPFAVINADDFYGRNAFEQAVRFLQTGCDTRTFGIVGYDLAATLSEHGTVNRGVCQLNKEGDLASITERINIARVNGMAAGISIIPCDVEVGEIQKLRSLQGIAEIKLTGGGGTDMGVGISAAAQLKPTPKVVIVLTDGYTPWPEAIDPKIESLIICCSAEESLASVPAYSKAIDMSRK